MWERQRSSGGLANYEPAVVTSANAGFQDGKKFAVNEGELDFEIRVCSCSRRDRVQKYEFHFKHEYAHLRKLKRSFYLAEQNGSSIHICCHESCKLKIEINVEANKLKRNDSVPCSQPQSSRNVFLRYVSWSYALNRSFTLDVYTYIHIRHDVYHSFVLSAFLIFVNAHEIEKSYTIVISMLHSPC